ncbi:RNA polymerase sigma factor SigZ [Cohnella suwonensis]|uniref:RNA polymerase sigma factor n=1 Tax=Cohnella suwonensis TaxID=696072 RepID=A0ABW0LYU9_9BACL
MELDEVWSNFHGQLQSFISSRTRRPQDAEDILQNVYVKILTQIHTLRNEQKLHAWIFQITRNTLIDYYRKEKPIEELPDELPMLQESESNLNHELLKCLKSFIDRLPEKYRQAIQLTEYEGYTQKQLSEYLDISFSGAKSRVQRGRQKLKELIFNCCQFELDRFGNILDYHPSKPITSRESCNCNKSCVFSHPSTS